MYSVFGLLLRSNLPIPKLKPRDNCAAVPDVEAHLGISPYSSGEITPAPEEIKYVSSYLDPSGEPALRIWQLAHGGFLRLQYSDGMQFWLDREGRNVWALWPAASSLEDAATYLLGPVLGFLLRLRGVTCLHASVVAFGDRAIALVGAEGRGKSTTAAALARCGCSVLSDDIAALVEREGIFHVAPAYPYVSLWPDSVEMVEGSSEALPRFIPNWEKRCLDLGSRGLQFEERALPLGAVYLLGDRRADRAPTAEAVPSQTAFLALVANTFATKTLDIEMRAKEFEVLGRLISRVPIRQLSPHCDARRLNELCQLVCEDFRSFGLH